MKKSVMILIGVGVILALLALVGCTPAIAGQSATGNNQQTGTSPNQQTTGIVVTNQPTGISVNGEGRVRVTPDLAIARLGFEVRSKTVAEAQSEGASKMQAVIATLKAKGLADKDIQTSRFSIFSEPQMENGRQVGTLYRLTNVVTTKIRQMDRVGEILDAAVSAGANRVEGLAFTVEDPTPVTNEARNKAMADAKAKAEQLASQAGVKVGSPISISEGGGIIPLEFRAPLAAPAGKGGADMTPISPGENEVSLFVNVTYEIVK